MAKDESLVFNCFCKLILRLGKNEPTYCVYGELGLLPLSVLRKHRILKYWLHIVSKKTKVVFNVCKLL